MREVVILLLVVVLAIMVLGAVNQDQHVDFDYVVGTWDNASVLELSAVAAGIVFISGVVGAAIVRGGLIGSRRKLERELQETYVRLRAAEAAAPAAESASLAVAGPVAAGQPALAASPDAGEATVSEAEAGHAEAGTAGGAEAGDSLPDDPSSGTPA